MKTGEANSLEFPKNKNEFELTYLYPKKDEILQVFAGMGHKTLTDETTETHFLGDGNMFERYRPIKRFVCQVYNTAKINIDCSSSSMGTIP